MPSKILIAAAHPLLRDYLFCKLAVRYSPALLLQCATGGEVVSLSGNGVIGHIVMDLNFADIDGLDVLLALRAVHCAVPVTVCLDRFDRHTLRILQRVCPHSIFDVRATGATKFQETIVHSIAGATHCSESIARCWRDWRSHGPPPWFTERQLQLRALFSCGYDDKRIAEATTRSVHTIRTLRRLIYRKCEVHCATALASFAAEYGVLRYAADRVFTPGLNLFSLLNGGGENLRPRNHALGPPPTHTKKP